MAAIEDLKFCQILVELMPNLPEAKDAIQLAVEELGRGTMIHWCNIGTVLGQLYQCNFCRVLRGQSSADISQRLEYLENLIVDVLSLFDRYECSDISVIADVLELLCLTRKIDSMSNYEMWMETSLNRLYGKTSMTIFEKSLVLSYKDLPSVVNPLIYKLRNNNFVELLTVNGDADYLKCIITFGATLIVPERGPFNGLQHPGFIMKLYSQTNLTFNPFDIPCFASRFTQNYAKLDEYSRKRLYLIITVMEVLFKTDFHERTEEYLECARIFLNSTPEPLITFQETKCLFTKICSGIVSNDEVLPILEEYQTHFPESHEVSTPRSLKHLSRFQVRESLRTARSFPYGVKSLSVPEKIQDYICFMDILG